MIQEKDAQEWMLIPLSFSVIKNLIAKTVL